MKSVIIPLYKGKVKIILRIKKEWPLSIEARHRVGLWLVVSKGLVNPLLVDTIVYKGREEGVLTIVLQLDKEWRKDLEKKKKLYAAFVGLE